MKKRLGVFATLAMCATIGSVYATWTFAENAIAATQEQTAALEMGGVEVVTKGGLSVGKNGLKFVIDDTDNNHIGELVPQGSIIVTYTPTATGDVDCSATQTEVTMTCTISVSGDVFTVARTTITKENATEWTINASDLGVSLANSVELHTKEAYDKFKEDLAKNSISIVISAV